MFPWESRRTRRSGRDRGRGRARPDLAALECLEGRELMAYSPLGFSLPDLTVDGFAAPAAAWGGPLAVTVDVSNIGASTINEPLSLSGGLTSTADAQASTVAVYALRNPRSFAGAVQVGSIDVPAIAQNNATQITSIITLPNRPPGFPGDGGRVYLAFQANATGTVFESDTGNNVSTPVLLRIEAPLPELAAVGLDVPPVMQPGDTIQPNIRVANLGPNDTLDQGPVQVALVASTTPTFSRGSSIVAVYNVANIPGVYSAAAKGLVLGDANLTPPQNVVTIAGDPVTLPLTPARYYLGVVVDPFGRIKQLHAVPNFVKPRNPFSLAQPVGPPIGGLPPAGVVVPGGVADVPQFPIPFGLNPVGGSITGGVATFPATFPPTAPTFITGIGILPTGSGLGGGSLALPLPPTPTPTSTGFTQGPITPGQNAVTVPNGSTPIRRSVLTPRDRRKV